MADEVRKNLNGCSQCGVCESQCLFLKKYGSTGIIAGNILAGRDMPDPFECSLCNLCGAVCPEELSPVDLFLAMRRQSVTEGSVDLARYSPLIKYEKTGHSDLFSWYPSGSCRTIFFPGCTLPGTRPKITWKFFENLKKIDPDLEMVLDCCHKPSHDLGRQNFFMERFQVMVQKLKERGISKILVACPNCFKIFANYGSDFTVRTVYQVLAENNGFKPAPYAGTLAVHDPCPLRYQDEVQTSVRILLAKSGFQTGKMKETGKNTLCCGEGGAVAFHNPGFAGAWSLRRSNLAGDHRMVTYCAGCAGFLGRHGKVSHIGEVLFEPEKAMAGKSSVSKTPATYLNRLLLKRRLSKGKRRKSWLP